MTQTRIYEDIIEINKEDVLNFWTKRAELDNLNSVLLGNQKTIEENINRNEKEKKLLELFLKNSSINLENCSILDIGCGMGRWANNFANKIEAYTGIDFTESFIIKNKEKFKEFKNINFHTMPIEEINLEKLSKNYDCIIITGVLMYVNDSKLDSVFEKINLLNPKTIYLQESICTQNSRLSLNKFYSQELNCDYSAIYRTKNEYEEYFENHLKTYKIANNGLLIKQNKETSPMYWFFKKQEIL